MLTPAEVAAAEDLWPFQRELDIQTAQLLSVTGIMRRAGLVRFHVPREHLAALATSGRDVHLVCEDIARGTISNYWTDLPDVAPYARGFQKFVQDFDFKAELIEHRLEHPWLGYNGRLDQAGFLFANSRSRRRAVVIDVKRGVAAPSHPYQTAGYAELVNQARLFGKGRIIERWCIYLHPEGYRPKRHDNHLDFLEFTCLLATARIRQAAGLVDARDEWDFDNLLRYASREARDEEPRL